MRWLFVPTRHPPGHRVRLARRAPGPDEVPAVKVDSSKSLLLVVNLRIVGRDPSMVFRPRLDLSINPVGRRRRSIRMEGGRRSRERRLSTALSLSVSCIGRLRHIRCRSSAASRRRDAPPDTHAATADLVVHDAESIPLSRREALLDKRRLRPERDGTGAPVVASPGAECLSTARRGARRRIKGIAQCGKGGWLKPHRVGKQMVEITLRQRLVAALGYRADASTWCRLTAIASSPCTMRIWTRRPGSAIATASSYQSADLSRGRPAMTRLLCFPKLSVRPALLTKRKIP
jgi:hypothetical protein